MDTTESVTALAIVRETWEPGQLEIIKEMIAPGASNGELALFAQVCRRTGLDPFAKQIYAVMRNSREKDANGKWTSVKKMTIQTGIDGYRLMAARTGELAGIDDVEYDTEDADNPSWARVTVWRLVQGHRVPFAAKARWKEYAQMVDEYDGDSKTGKQKPGSMWAKMPYLMLGKCAEALALRKAFPAEISGIYTAEEMSQADNDPAPYVESATPRATPVAPSQATTTVKPTANGRPTPYKLMSDTAALTRLAELGVDTDNASDVQAFFAKRNLQPPFARAAVHHILDQAEIKAALEARAVDATPATEAHNLHELGTVRV